MEWTFGSMEEKDIGLNVKDDCSRVVGRLNLNPCSSSDVRVFPSPPCAVDIISLSPPQRCKPYEEVTGLNVPYIATPRSHLRIGRTP